jgi:hypothetical protein
MALLTQNRFDLRIVSPKGCSLFLGNLYLGSSVGDPVALAQFFRKELQFAL